MSLAARIDRFLASVHSADNMASARDKLAEATNLLREVVSAKASAKAGAPHSVPVAKMTAKWRRKA